MIRDVYCGSRIEDPDFFPSSRDERSTRSRIWICNTACVEAEDFPLYFYDVYDCCRGAGCVTRCSDGALCACPASLLTTPTWKPRGAMRPPGCPLLTPVSRFEKHHEEIPNAVRLIITTIIKKSKD